LSRRDSPVRYKVKRETAVSSLQLIKEESFGLRTVQKKTKNNSPQQMREPDVNHKLEFQMTNDNFLFKTFEN